ncbi:MAG: hypothetical protein QXK47_04005 [Candidatus Bathyarchaeia archaeon]
MADFALAIKGARYGIIESDINICVIGYGAKDAPNVTVHLTRPDGSTRTYSTSVLPLYRGGLDVKVVTIPKTEVTLAGNYTIYADTTIDATVYTSNTLIVSVPSKIRTLTFTLKDPIGNPMKESYGSIAIIHKKSASMAIYVTDANGQITVPEFATDKDWLMEVHFRNPNNPKLFDMKLYDPVDFRVLPTEFRATGWYSEKYYKIEIEIDREKFIDFLAIKNPLLAKHTWFIDNYPVLAAYTVANEILGGLPYLLIQSASYSATDKKLTVYFKGLGVAPFVVFMLLLIGLAGVVATGVAVTSYFEARKAEAEAAQAKNRVEAEQQYWKLVEYVASLRATGALTKEDVEVLLSSATEYSSKWQPPAVIPSWVWGVVAIIVILVIAYIAYQIFVRVKPKRGR